MLALTERSFTPHCNHWMCLTLPVLFQCYHAGWLQPELLAGLPATNTSSNSKIKGFMLDWERRSNECCISTDLMQHKKGQVAKELVKDGKQKKHSSQLTDLRAAEVTTHILYKGSWCGNSVACGSYNCMVHDIIIRLQHSCSHETSSRDEEACPGQDRNTANQWAAAQMHKSECGVLVACTSTQ